LKAQIGCIGEVVVWVHGWMSNRLGNVAGQTPVPDGDENGKH
jgi:hypothetical protein